MQHTAAFFFFYLLLREFNSISLHHQVCTAVKGTHKHTRACAHVCEHTQSGKHVVKIAVMKMKESLNSSKMGTLRVAPITRREETIDELEKRSSYLDLWKRSLQRPILNTAQA